MTTDSETMEKYLNFVRTRFLIPVPSFCVPWLRTWNKILIDSCLLTEKKNMEIEVSAFGNFSTDTYGL